MTPEEVGGKYARLCAALRETLVSAPCNTPLVERLARHIAEVLEQWPETGADTSSAVSSTAR